MKSIHYKTAFRIWIAGAAALVLIVSMLTILGAADKTAQAAGARSDVTMAAGTKGQLAVALSTGPQKAIASTSSGPLPALQGTITPTLAVTETEEPYDRDWPDMPIVPVDPPPLPDWVVELMNTDDVETTDNGNLSIVKLAETASGDDSIIRNGETITYTILITNEGVISATNITILDLLPPNALNLVQCLDGGITCTQILDYIGPVTVTRQITWAHESLEANESITVAFSGKVTCQPDQAVFTNRAFVIYDQGEHINLSAASLPVTTTVRSSAKPGVGFGISTDPSWCSDGVGTNSIDWGDFDLDGDLDVALGSWSSVTVYRNDAGKLMQFWSDNHTSQVVRWADLDNDGKLELVSVGESGDPEASNYIYENELGETRVFTSEGGSIGVLEITDYDGDGYLDLAAGADAGCEIRLYKNDTTGNFAERTCIYHGTNPVMAWGDYDNDGDPDLATREYRSTLSTYVVRIFENKGGDFSDSFIVEPWDPYAWSPFGGALEDIAWGDYNNDGFLDLAVSSSLFFWPPFWPYTVVRVSVYRNPQHDFTSLDWDRADNVYTPTNTLLWRSDAEWADFNRDDQLDLVASNVPITIYQHSGSDSFSFSEIAALPEGVVEGWSWYFFLGSYFSDFNIPDVRGIDYDNDGDLDLALGNYYGRSTLFDNDLDSPLKREPTTIKSPLGRTAWPASSVAWGDTDQDGDLDLLFGAGTIGGLEAFGDKLYENNYYDNDNTLFPHQEVDEIGDTFGPNNLAFGDVDGNGELDIAIGSQSGQIELYKDGSEPAVPVFKFPDNSYSSVAWADADFDGDLDLLVGNTDANVATALFVNVGGQLTALPAWTSTETADARRSIAWAYFDDDFYPDFAVGNDGQPNRLYRNNGDNTFSLMNWNPSMTNDATRSIAWADYDGDGDMDLAVGNYDESNYIYENQNGSLSQTPVWTSLETSKTTSLAWGDWDHDDDLDLAVGNDGEADQVYVNLSEPGSPSLDLRWLSAGAYHTTGIAWGDQDNDGDLDLAVSGTDHNGVYENLYVSPAHLTNRKFAKMMPLPNNPSYLSIARPGSTPAADFFSSPEILSGAADPVVTITYKLYDPDGSRNDGALNAFGDQIAKTLYQYSADGGGTWQTATPAGNWSGPSIQTSRLGQKATFLWDATKDKVLSHDARFRITIMQGRYHSGVFQRASTSAVSPPFRVMGMTCVWPTSPTISYSPENPQTGNLVRFEGAIQTGSGVLTFTWNFGDGSTGIGQMVQHSYKVSNTYTVTLTVSGEPCPVTEPTVITRTITVSGGVLANPIYLPHIHKSARVGSGGGTVGAGSHILYLPLIMKPATGVIDTGRSTFGTLPMQETGLWSPNQARNNDAGRKSEW